MIVHQMFTPSISTPPSSLLNGCHHAHMTCLQSRQNAFPALLWPLTYFIPRNVSRHSASRGFPCLQSCPWLLGLCLSPWEEQVVGSCRFKEDKGHGAALDLTHSLEPRLAELSLHQLLRASVPSRNKDSPPYGTELWVGLVCNTVVVRAANRSLQQRLFFFRLNIPTLFNWSPCAFPFCISALFLGEIYKLRPCRRHSKKCIKLEFSRNMALFPIFHSTLPLC